MDIKETRLLKKGDTVKFFVKSQNTLYCAFQPEKEFICTVDEVSDKTWFDERQWDRSRNGQAYCWVKVTELNVKNPKSYTVDSFRLYR